MLHLVGLRGSTWARTQTGNTCCLLDINWRISSNEICADFYGGNARPFVQKEFDFITTDRFLQQCIRILSLFGKKGRYYNLDVVTGSVETAIDPTGEWRELESKVENATPFLKDSEALHRDYFPRVHSRLIAKWNCSSEPLLCNLPSAITLIEAEDSARCQSYTGTLETFSMSNWYHRLSSFRADS